MDGCTVRVVARKCAPRNRGGAEEYQLKLIFRWANGHTMAFNSNDTVLASLMHRTIIPALQDAFPMDLRGVPGSEHTDHHATTTLRQLAGSPGSPSHNVRRYAVR